MVLKIKKVIYESNNHLSPINDQLQELQKELLKKAHNNQKYDEFVKEIYELLEEKQRVIISKFYEIYFSSQSSGTCSCPQAHNASRIGISDIPSSVREYSTFGGICGYSLRKMTPSASNYFS